MSETKLKPMPQFATDEAEERFVDEADLSEYDLSGFRPVEFGRVGEIDRLTIELTSPLLHALDEKAAKTGRSMSELVVTLPEAHLEDL